MTDLLDIAIRSSVILALALVADGLMRRAPAALRHVLLAGALLTAAFVGPLGSVLPAWTLPVPSAASFGSSEAGRTGRASASLVVPAVDDAASSGAGLHGTFSSLAQWAPPALLAGWLIGVGLCAWRLLLSHQRLRRLARQARPLDDDAWTSASRAAARGMGVRRPVTLLATEASDVLATWGILRPRILVPAHARRWPQDRIDAVLLHEITHVARGDWLVQAVADVVLAAYWFNPLAWLAARRLRAASERACDDAVLRHGIPARAYATHLFEVARACRAPAASFSPALSVAAQSDLHGRITAMLNAPFPAAVLSRRIVALIVLALVAIAVPVAALRVAPEGPHRLAGVVYDVTGAVVPGAKLTLGAEGQAPWESVSDDAGRFEFGSIPAGRYVLAVAVPGFRTLKQSLDLQRDGDWERAITLQLGDVQETITIRSARLPAPPAAGVPARVRVGGKVSPPRKLRDARPEYPESMRAAGIEGNVALEAIIGRDGSVQSARVVSGMVHPDLAQAAIDAVRQWTFEPTLLNGKPVEVVMNVAMTFELDQ